MNLKKEGLGANNTKKMVNCLNKNKKIPKKWSAAKPAQDDRIIFGAYVIPCIDKLVNQGNSLFFADDAFSRCHEDDGSGSYGLDPKRFCSLYGYGIVNKQLILPFPGKVYGMPFAAFDADFRIIFYFGGFNPAFINGIGNGYGSRPA